MILGDEKEYYSADSINKSDALQNLTSETVTPEFLNSLNTSKDGLCNGTRLIISRLGAHIIEERSFPRRTLAIKHIFQG